MVYYTNGKTIKRKTGDNVTIMILEGDICILISPTFLLMTRHFDYCLSAGLHSVLGLYTRLSSRPNNNSCKPISEEKKRVISSSEW